MGILIIKKANFHIPIRKLFIILLKRTIDRLVLFVFGIYVYYIIVMVDCFQNIYDFIRLFFASSAFLYPSAACLYPSVSS